jgi:COP9 signalosome complex subunit 1
VLARRRLTRAQTRHALDLHLAPHVAALGALVRDRCLVMYLQPFASIRLARMSAAFGWPVDAVERAVVGLIQAGEVKARVDSLEKVLRAKDVDPRAELFVRATAVGKEMQSATRKLLLRLRLFVALSLSRARSSR